MKKFLIPFLAGVILLSISSLSFASPDFNNPATETGTLQLFGDDDFYINGFELEDLSKSQEHQLRPLVGKKVTIKGFYEKKNFTNTVDEIYVSEIIPQ